MAFLTQSLNAFTNSNPILGQVENVPTPNVVTGQITPSSSATAIQTGSAVKLVSGTGAIPLYDVCTGPTDGPVAGVIPYNERKNVYAAGDIIEVAQGASYLWLKSSAAITRGDKVTSTAATTTADPTVATVTVASTQYVTGIAIDSVAGANTLLRIEVKPSFNSGV